jgi:hypothetical protein
MNGRNHGMERLRGQGVQNGETCILYHQRLHIWPSTNEVHHQILKLIFLFVIFQHLLRIFEVHQNQGEYLKSQQSSHRLLASLF